MTRIPLKYVTGSLLQRPMSTTLTVASFALVVLVLIGLLSMVQGIDASLIGAGDPARFFVMDARATAENQSHISDRDARAIGLTPGIRLAPSAEPLTSYELVSTVYVVTPGNQQVQVTIRGVDLEAAVQVHDAFRVVAGRMFHPDAENEVIIGKGALTAMGLTIGSTFEAKKRSWIAVGAFADRGSPFESEVWMPRSAMEIAFARDYISSVWALVDEPAVLEPVVTEINDDKGLSVYATTERAYFAKGGGTAGEIKALAAFVTAIMSFGAVFSAMNTMYASVSDRRREFGALRALGFPPHAVIRVILTESLLIATAGGLLACVLAAALNGITFRTVVTGVGFVTFRFLVTPALLASGLLFAVGMGMAGGIAPARRAMRASIVTALKG